MCVYVIEAGCVYVSVVGAWRYVCVSGLIVHRF